MTLVDTSGSIFAFVNAARGYGERYRFQMHLDMFSTVNLNIPAEDTVCHRMVIYYCRSENSTASLLIYILFGADYNIP